MKIKSSLTPFSSAFIALLILSPIGALGAHIDCLKAKGGVEKLVCASPDLRRLDLLLGNQYELALKRAATDKDREALRQTQREWLTSRNACADRACLSASYSARIAGLPKTPQSSAPPLVPATNYPNVWDLVFKQNPKMRSVPPKEPGFQNVELRILGDADVLVSYENREWAPPWFEDITFFSHDRYRDVEAAFGGRYRGSDARQVIRLPSGKRVWSKGLRLNPCYRRPEATVEVQDVAGKPLIERTVLYLLDHAKIYRTNKAAEHCADGPDFPYQVVVLQPDFVGLGDGTFLAADSDAAVVIRFDEHLRTRSQLLGKRLFILDPKKFRADMAPYWGDRANEQLNWKRFHEALYQLVRGLSRGE